MTLWKCYSRRAQKLFTQLDHIIADIHFDGETIDTDPMRHLQVTRIDLPDATTKKVLARCPSINIVFVRDGDIGNDYVSQVPIYYSGIYTFHNCARYVMS